MSSWTICYERPSIWLRLDPSLNISRMRFKRTNQDAGTSLVITGGCINSLLILDGSVLLLKWWLQSAETWISISLVYWNCLKTSISFITYANSVIFGVRTDIPSYQRKSQGLENWEVISTIQLHCLIFRMTENSCTLWTDMLICWLNHSPLVSFRSDILLQTAPFVHKTKPFWWTEVLFPY